MTSLFLDPRGQLDPPVGEIPFFGSKEVRWISLLVTSRFWIKGGQLDPPVGDVTFFWIKGSQLDPPVGDVTLLDQRRSVGDLCQ